MTEPAKADSDPQAFLHDLVASVAHLPGRGQGARLLRRSHALAGRPSRPSPRPDLAGSPRRVERVADAGATNRVRAGAPSGRASTDGATISQPRDDARRMAHGVRRAGRCARCGCRGRLGGVGSRALADARASNRPGRRSGSATSTLGGDLAHACPRGSAGHVPAEAVAAVGRIAELLVDTLPRVAGQGEPEVDRSAYRDGVPAGHVARLSVPARRLGGGACLPGWHDGRPGAGLPARGARGGGEEDAGCGGRARRIRPARSTAGSSPTGSPASRLDLFVTRAVRRSVRSGVRAVQVASRPGDLLFECVDRHGHRLDRLCAVAVDRIHRREHVVECVLERLDADARRRRPFVDRRRLLLEELARCGRSSRSSRR